MGWIAHPINPTGVEITKQGSVVAQRETGNQKQASCSRSPDLADIPLCYFTPGNLYPQCITTAKQYKQYQWGLVTALKLRIQELCFLSSHVSSGATTYPRFMTSTRVCLPFVLCHPTTRFSTPHSLSREPETMHSIFQLCLPSVTAVTAVCCGRTKILHFYTPSFPLPLL